MRPSLAIIACVLLAACGDPIADFQRLSEQDIPENTATADVVAAPETQDGGLFARLLGPQPAPEAVDPAKAITPEASASPDTTSAPVKRSGLLGLLTGQAKSQTGATAVQASLRPEDPSAMQPQSQPAAVSQIPPGTMLPYGRVARVCGLANRDLGKKVAQYPERSPVHKIYDSDPGNTAPHSFFITGFDDRCARQFTASLAMFGSVDMHEQLRYGLPADVQPYSDTDKAYEKLKSRVCGVPRKKPCGSKVSRLQRNTVFVSIYERFGSNPQWTNLLLHGGQVLAQDRKGG